MKQVKFRAFWQNDIWNIVALRIVTEEYSDVLLINNTGTESARVSLEEIEWIKFDSPVMVDIKESNGYIKRIKGEVYLNSALDSYSPITNIQIIEDMYEKKII